MRIVEITTGERKGQRFYVKQILESELVIENVSHRNVVIDKKHVQDIPFLPFLPGDVVTIIGGTRNSPFKIGDELPIFSVNQLDQSYTFLHGDMGWVFEKNHVKK